MGLLKARPVTVPGPRMQADTNQTVESTCREDNISKATFHRWRRKYGDLDIADAKRLKELEKENAELKKMLAEAMLL